MRLPSAPVGPRPLARLWPALLLTASLLLLLSLLAHTHAAEPASSAQRQQTGQTAPTEFRFVQITDTHIGRAPENAQRLQRLIACINALVPQPELVIHTGDIVDKRQYEGGPAQEAKNLFSVLKAPLLCLPGNNDLDVATAERDRALWQRYFGPLAQVQTVRGVRFVLFCAEPLRGGYALKDYDPLAWLRGELSAAKEHGEPALLFLHAPPVPDFYENAPHGVYPPSAERALLELLGQMPPAALIAGHFHRDEQHDMTTFPIYVCPPIDSRWGRQAAFRLYTVRRTTNQKPELSFTTQYDPDLTGH